MPQLETTYFLSQFFWCITTLLLVYFTVSKNFYYKYNIIISQRDALVKNYKKEYIKKLIKIESIKKQLQKNKRKLLVHFAQQKNSIKVQTNLHRKQKLIFFKKDIQNINFIHNSFLNNFKNKLDNDLYEYILDNNKATNLFFLNKK